ncbi:MAG: hypothetical protein ACOCP8_10005 [archaeon]
MNIAIAKIGKSVKFKSSTWSAYGGDNEAPLLFQTIAKLNPDVTFYMIGKSDFRRLKSDFKKEVAPHNNIIDIWEDYDKNKHNVVTYPYEWITKNNIKIDCGVLYTGPTSGATVPGIVKKKNGEPAKMLQCFKNYAGPIVDYLNKSNIPYFTLVPDPRYNPIQAKDLANRPLYGLSQYNGTYTSEHIKSFNDYNYINSEESITYDGIEKVFFLDKEKQDIYDIDKTIKFMIVLNEGGNGGLKRGPILDEYILEYFDDIEIYGKWKTKKYKEDERFKGALKFMDLQEKLPSVKYTFIIPIEEGWATSKFWEMINYGIIPFMHPYYDKQRNIDCPGFLRINSPKELREKIDFLENNPNEYKKLLNQLSEMLKDDYYNGNFMNNIIMKNINKIINK